jgi:hypothetical protein
MVTLFRAWAMPAIAYTELYKWHQPHLDTESQFVSKAHLMQTQ